jgi:hypothetical protein
MIRADTISPTTACKITMNPQRNRLEFTTRALGQLHEMAHWCVCKSGSRSARGAKNNMIRECRRHSHPQQDAKSAVCVKLLPLWRTRPIFILYTEPSSSSSHAHGPRRHSLARTYYTHGQIKFIIMRISI